RPPLVAPAGRQLFRNRASFLSRRHLLFQNQYEKSFSSCRLGPPFFASHSASGTSTNRPSALASHSSPYISSAQESSSGSPRPVILRTGLGPYCGSHVASKGNVRCAARWRR